MNEVLELESKARRVFGGDGILVHKGLSNLSENFRKLPRFVADYLISTLVDPSNPSSGIAKIDKLMLENFVDSEDRELVKAKIREKRSHHLIGNIRCRYDQSKDMYWAEINALGDHNVRISPYVLADHGESLLTTGAWGTIEVSCDPNFVISRKMYPFIVTNFQPFQITKINVDDWINGREQFSFKEWSDLLVSSIGFNPEKLSTREKIILLVRLIPFVESNINLIELGTVCTGKTFCYRALSSYGFIVSGSKISVASLFFNKLRKKIGVLGHKDCVMFDEIGHSNWNGQDELSSMLKDYMNTGQFSRDIHEFSSECSIVFAGNIDCDIGTKTVRPHYRHLFMPLPSLINGDRAFLDRIHGFISGWQAVQVADEKLSKQIGFMADYLSEIMHRMRKRNYSHIIMNKVDFGKMTIRNQTSITKISSGLLKLLFPHKTYETIENKELKFVLDISVELRQRVLDQLAIISPGEFSGLKLEYKIKE